MSSVVSYVERSRQADEHKQDYVLRADALRVSQEGNLAVPYLLEELPPLAVSDRALRHMLEKLGPVVYGKGSGGILPYTYFKAIPPALRAINLNSALERAEGREWRVRTYGDEVRAVVDKRYSPISNTEILELLDGLLDHDRFDVNILPSYLTPDEVHLKTVWATTRDGQYGRGLYLHNNEVREGGCGVALLLQKNACTNSVIMGDLAVEFTHVGSTTVKMTELKLTIAKILEMSEAALDQLIAADFERLPSFSEILGGIAIQHGWGTEAIHTIRIGSSNQPTRGGLIAGITYAAHALPDLTLDERLFLEKLGGTILTAPDSLFAQAARRYQARLHEQTEEALALRGALD